MRSLKMKKEKSFKKLFHFLNEEDKKIESTSSTVTLDISNSLIRTFLITQVFILFSFSHFFLSVIFPGVYNFYVSL